MSKIDTRIFTASDGIVISRTHQKQDLCGHPVVVLIDESADDQTAVDSLLRIAAWLGGEIRNRSIAGTIGDPDARAYGCPF